MTVILTFRSLGRAPNLRQQLLHNRAKHPGQRRVQSSSQKPDESRQTAQSASRTPTTTTTSETPKPSSTSIFSPFVLPLTAPFRAYSRVQSRRPYVTQFISSLIIYFCGDLSSQYIQRDPSPDASFDYDPVRAVRAVIIGGISSIPSYRYFIYLSSHFNYFKTHIANLTLKVALNQLTFAPMFNCYFFGMQSLLSLETPQPEAMLDRIKRTVPQSWLMSCRFWPFVTAFSFTFIPIHNRSIFAGVMAVFWQTYLGIVNQRAVVQEMEQRQRPLT